jgi:hypothetical protein
MQLVDRQRSLERRSLVLVIPRHSICLGEVYPDGRLGRIAGSGGGEMSDRLLDVAPIEGDQPQLIRLVRVGGCQGFSPQ